MASVVGLGGCSKWNPDFCCETAAECDRSGVSELRPCEAGICVGNTCTESGCDGDEDCSNPTPYCDIAGDVCVSAPPPDASMDGASANCPPSSGTWSAPVKLTGPSTADSDAGPALSPSGLELFFYAPRDDEFGYLDVFVTKRAFTTDPWGTARNTIFEIDTAANAESQPYISADGLELFFVKAGFIYESTRSSPSVAWSGPEFTELSGSKPMLLQSGLTLYWFDPAASCPTSTCRMRATRSDVMSPWADPQLERFPDGDYQSVEVSGDGLRVLLSSPSTPAAAPVAIACRGAVGDTWGPVQAIPELQAFTNIRFARWSWDGSEMYLAVEDTAQLDLYVSRFMP